jgi:hypothetical protein
LHAAFSTDNPVNASGWPNLSNALHPYAFDGCSSHQLTEAYLSADVQPAGVVHSVHCIIIIIKWVT